MPSWMGRSCAQETRCGFRSGRCAFRTVLISLIQRMCNIFANVPSFGGRQDWESSRLLQIADKLAWERVSGRGKVYSYTVVRRASSRAFSDAPYVLAIVELAEGPRMTTNIVAPPEQVRVEMPVQVFFDDVTPDCTLVKFKPA